MGTQYLDHRGTGRSAVWRAVRAACTLLAVGVFGGLAVQCSTSSAPPPYGSGNGGSGNGNGGSGNGNGNGGGYNGGSGGVTINLDSGVDQISQDAFYVNDPPTNCPDAGIKPPVIGGTLQCPSDKNLPGCPCGSGVKVGDTAKCWPGYRKNRNHGACQDGTTTCTLEGENTPVWGPCVGYTGIDKQGNPLGTSGAAACTCFSHGQWTIDNTSPCFACSDQGCTSATGAVSTLKSTQQCPSSATTLPTEPWSGDTVSADCTGKFKLCYTLMALSAPNAPQAPATDCVMKQVCTEAHYDVANQTQPFPDLGAWITDTPAEKACAAAFVKNGGYAQMSVDGESDDCDKVQKVFATYTYCPMACNGPNPPAMCKQCTTGGTGGF